MQNICARPTTRIARCCSRRPTAACPGSISAPRTSAAAPPTSPSPTEAAPGASMSLRDERRLEDRRRRRDLAGDLRASAVHEHRRHRRRAVEPRHRLGRHRRGQPVPRLDARRRHLQVDRRRPDVHAHGPDRHADDRPHRRPPDQSRHRLRRGVGPRVDRQRDARRVQDDRRRQDLEQGPLPEPAHRRVRSGDGSRRSRTPSTPRCGSASAASGATRGSSPATTKAVSARRPTADAHGRGERRLPAAQFRGRIGIDISRSNPNVLYALVDNYEPGRPPRESERDAYSGRSSRARIKAAESLSHRRRGQDVAQSEREQRIHDRATPAPTAGCSGRSASIRATRTPSTRWAWGSTCRATPARRSRRFAACTAIITGSGSIRKPGRCSTTSTTAASTDRAMRGKTWKFRRRRRRVAVLQRRRSTAVRRPGRTARSRTSAAAADASISRPDATASRRSSGRMRQAAKARTTPSTVRTTTSSTRTGSTATSRVRISASAAAAAAPHRAAEMDEAAGEGAPASQTSGRPRGGRSRAARAVDGADHRLAARSGDGLPRVSVRVPVDEPRRHVGEDQPGSERNDPSQMLLKSSNAIPYQTIVALAESPTKPGADLRRHGRRPAARDAWTRGRPGPI